MGLRFAVSFVIILVLAIILSWLTKNILNGVILILIYALIKIVWNVLTK
ncbi:hypothetical protein ES702_04450 [subsurface metagenome]